MAGIWVLGKDIDRISANKWIWKPANESRHELHTVSTVPYRVKRQEQ
jgi:hypothetical protein